MKLKHLGAIAFSLSSLSSVYATTSNIIVSSQKETTQSGINNIGCTHEVPSADDRAVYFGIEGGITTPAAKKLKHKKGDIFLKSTGLYSARIGYSFYPGMSIEFSTTLHPKYKLSYILKPTADMPLALRDKTKINKKVFMINLLYDFAPFDCGITPYVVGGAGIVKLSVSPTSILSPSGSGLEIFKVLKHTENCPSWQVGLGLTKPITTNILFDISAKFQVLHNATIKYQQYDRSQGKLVPGKISSTAAFAEYTAGLTFKIPIKD